MALMVAFTDSEIFEESCDLMKTLLLLILEILPIFNIYKVGFSGLYHPDRRQHSGYFVPWVANKVLVQRCWKVCNEKMT